MGRLKAVYQWVLRTMMKDQTGVMQTLPRKDLIDFNVMMTAERLMRGGIDPSSLKNANQVENAINMIDDRPKVQEGIKSTGKVFDMEGKEIPRGSDIVGGKAVPGTSSRDRARKEMKEKYGFTDKRLDEIENTQIIDEKMMDDLVKQDDERIIKERLEKQNKEGIARIRERQKMLDDAIDNQSPSLSGDTRTDAVLVAEDLAERMGLVYDDLPIREQTKLYDQAYQGLSKMRFEARQTPKGAPPKITSKKDADSQESSYDDGPADFDPDADDPNCATGGRAGFANGTGAPSIKLFPRASGRQLEGEVGPGFKVSERDINYGITGLLQGDKFFGGAEIDKGKVKVDVVSPDGNTLFKDTISKPDAVNFILGMGDPRGNKFQVKTDKDFENMQITFNAKFNQGGRAGFFMGSKFPKGLATLREIINAVTKESDVIKNPSNVLRLSNPKSFNKMLEDVKGKVMPKEGIMATDKVKDYQTEMARDRIKTVRDLLESGKNLKALDNTRAKLIDTYMKEIMRRGNFNEEQAKGIVTQLVDIEVGKSSGAKLTVEGISQLENILKNMETGGKEARDLNADGGRIGFKDGMTRRTFLKIFGGLVSLPIIGKIVKPLKLTTGVKKVPIIKTDNVPGKPEWFDALVNKVIVEGDDVTKKFATAERQSIHQKTLDDGSVVRVTEDVDDGAVRVEYESKTNPYEETTQLEYKKPLPDEGAPDPKAEFSAAETGPIARSDSPRLDYEKDIEEFATGNVDELVTDFSKLKEYATGKKPTMKEIVEAKKKKDQAKKLTEGDFDAEFELMEKRQGQPFYDPSPPDDFASGGIARMLGE